MTPAPNNFGKPRLVRWFAAPRPKGPPGYLLPRWIFLRVLGLIYFSAFYSLVFQIRGLIAPDGLLPANAWLNAVAGALDRWSFWYAPTLLWFANSGPTLSVLCWIGMIAALLLTINLWPRGMLVLCWVLYLSFVAVAQAFANYQSDGMLLAAGCIAFFFAPSGWRPGWGAAEPPSRASLFLLQWLWFRIYFESGVAKWFGDPAWRHLTAMDQYYQNGPLPTWLAWYAQQLPHAVQAFTAAFTLVVELLVVWMLFFPRRFRMTCFLIVTPMQIGIILTANYTFLNYLVLFLGVLLLDDRLLLRWLPFSWAVPVRENLAAVIANGPLPENPSSTDWPARAREYFSAARLWLAALLLGWVLYATTFLLAAQFVTPPSLFAKPVAALSPFRIANQYGLFAGMTWQRDEIEFQGSNDGIHWTAYPFRYKPQDPETAPAFFAPYQPRFDWNLWFASLGDWRDNRFVLHTEALLLVGDPDVLALFAGNPFATHPPIHVRAVLWQYWFTDAATRHATGRWWRRKFRRLYAPALRREPNGKLTVTAWPAPS